MTQFKNDFSIEQDNQAKKKMQDLQADELANGSSFAIIHSGHAASSSEMFWSSITEEKGIISTPRTTSNTTPINHAMINGQDKEDLKDNKFKSLSVLKLQDLSIDNNMSTVNVNITNISSVLAADKCHEDKKQQQQQQQCRGQVKVPPSLERVSPVVGKTMTARHEVRHDIYGSMSSRSPTLSVVPDEQAQLLWSSRNHVRENISNYHNDDDNHDVNTIIDSEIMMLTIPIFHFR
ncbi:hypothetical protein V1514DRAFT_171198 [Lipomyces japonicus]|uniref:uncharacterized protein n=1 Tax=Lipomyces japonicus TaxID=56871 RepID=UPI0034D01687